LGLTVARRQVLALVLVTFLLEHKKMKTVVIIALLATPLLPPAQGQDRHDWLSLGQLQPGDRIRLSLKTGQAAGAFQNWTAQDVTVGTVTARKEDVLKIERYRHGAWGRGKTAAVGALIGFGGGFVIGAAAGGCHQGQFGPCLSRGGLGAGLGFVGAVFGAGIGALLPRHTKTLIYSAR
jgi:hypothetical protein